MSNHHIPRPSLAQMIHRLSVPIALFWLGLAAITNIAVPQLEAVGQAHNVSLSPQDAPSLQAMKRIGKVFHEFDSDSAAMILLEGDKPKPGKPCADGIATAALGDSSRLLHRCSSAVETSRQQANSHATPHEGFASSDTTLWSQTDSTGGPLRPTHASGSFDVRQSAPFPATIHPVATNGSRRY